MGQVSAGLLMQSLDRKLVHARLGIFSLTPLHHHNTHPHTHFFQYICVYFVVPCVSDREKESRKEREVKGTAIWWQSPVCTQILCVYMLVCHWISRTQNTKQLSQRRNTDSMSEAFFGSITRFSSKWWVWGSVWKVQLVLLRYRGALHPVVLS